MKQKKDSIEIVNREIIQSYLITTAKYSFSSDEKKVLTAIIANLQPLLEGQKLSGKIDKDLWGDFHIESPIGDYISDGQNYKRVKEAFFALNEKKFIYEDEDIEEVIRIVERPKIYKRGYIQYVLNPKIVDCFLNFNKGYSKYELAVSLSFNSVYSMRMYELMSNQQHDISYKIDTLKEMFSLTEKYKYNKDFIQNVIVSAKKELDEKSPWTFNYVVNKKGRAFYSIKFTPIYQKDKQDTNITEAELKRQANTSWIVGVELKNYLKFTCAFSDREIKNNEDTFKIIVDLFSNSILDKIQEIWGRARNAENPKGYLISALQNIAKSKTL